MKKVGFCPVSETMVIIGGKWKPIILYCSEFNGSRLENGKDGTA